MSGQLCENYDVKQETVHCYLQNVDHCCTWSLESKRGFQILLLFCFANNKSLNDWSLGEQWILFPQISMFPETKSKETLRFSVVCVILTPGLTPCQRFRSPQWNTFLHHSRRHLYQLKVICFFWHTKECCSFAVTTILLRKGGLGTKLLSFYFFNESGNLIRNYNTVNVMKFGWMSNFTG